MAKISHSSWSKYLTCPKLWDYHYNERLRTHGTSSALVFGSAVDEALNFYLVDFACSRGACIDKTKVVDEFQKHFKYYDLDDVEWGPKDYDEDLFTPDQLEDVSKYPWGYRCWASMRIKGRMLLEAYIDEIGPLIEEVISVQREIKGRPGKLDVILKLKEHGTVLIDNKTSARPYDPSDTAKSTQLALYAEAEGIGKVGFIVLNKQFKKDIKKVCQKCGYDGSARQHKTCDNIVRGKRCHGPWERTVKISPNIQLLVDKVNKQTQSLVSGSMAATEKAIEQEVFPRNLNACSKMYGKPCPYYSKCWYGSDKGLVKQPIKEKK